MKRISQIAWLPALLVSLACSLLSSISPSATSVPPSSPATDTPIDTPPTSLPLPVLEGVIAFSSERDGIWQIVAMNADGSDETGLTASYGRYSRPAWSPNGQQIAMRMDIEMGGGIAVMDVRRENGRLLGAPPVPAVNAFADGPRWAPDGTKLVYVTSEGSGGWLTYVVELSSAAISRVPGIPEHATNPDWSPAGNQIVFSHYADPARQVRDLYVINTDGSGLVQLTNTPSINEDEPIWSPDGQKIVFTSFVDDQNSGINKDIFVMNRDGTNVSRLTSDPGSDFDPSWSPDGTQIVFVSDRHDSNDNNYEIYLINDDGSGELRLTNNHFTDRWPSWRAKQPDDLPVTDCQPAATLVADVTIPAGTRFATPQSFTKVWRLQNSGDCTWTPTNYTLRFAEGEQLGDSTQVIVPGAIQPGATVDLAIPQVAPDVPGRHVARWQLFQRNGQAVSGPDGSPVTFAVDIEVLAPGTTVLPGPLYFLSEQSGSMQIWRMEVDARSVAQITNEDPPVVSFEVSATGRIAYTSQNQVIISDANGGNRQVVASLEADGRTHDLAWSSDGNRLAYAAQGIHLYDTATGQDSLLIADKDTQAPDLARYGPLEWSPDGSKLAVTKYMWEGAAINILSTSTGALLADLPQEPLTWNRDSQSVYLASSQYPGMTGIDPGLWRGLTTGEAPQHLIAGASIWWPVQRSDGTLTYFMHQPTTPETREYSALLYSSSADGSNLVAVSSWPLLISSSDTFRGMWPQDGQSVLVQLVRLALDMSEVLLLSANEDPPVYLMSEISEFQWGR